MLPDFRVVVELQPGQRHRLLVRDVPACVFWQGYPEPSEDPSIAARHTHRLAELLWFEHLLTRVTLRPQLSLTMVRAMGSDYWPPLRQYLEAIGYEPHVVAEAVEPAEVLDVFPEQATAAAQDVAAYRATLPPAGMRRLLRELAERMHLSAGALWLAPISEMLFGYWCYLGDEERARVPLPNIAAAQRPAPWASTAFPPFGRPVI